MTDTPTLRSATDEEYAEYDRIMDDDGEYMAYDFRQDSSSWEKPEDDETAYDYRSDDYVVVGRDEAGDDIMGLRKDLADVQAWQEHYLNICGCEQDRYVCRVKAAFNLDDLPF